MHQSTQLLSLLAKKAKNEHMDCYTYHFHYKYMRSVVKFGFLMGNENETILSYSLVKR